MINMYHSPRCPTCDKELTSVGERQEFTFRFNEAAGFYEADMRADLMEDKCLYCKSDVSQLFEDGVYNYQTPKVEDQPNYRLPN